MLFLFIFIFIAPTVLKFYMATIFYSKITLVNRKKVTVTKLRYRLFFIFTILNTYVRLIIRAKIRPKISSSSAKEVDLVFFAI